MDETRRPKEEPSHGFNIFRQLEKAFSWGAPPGARAQPVPEEPALRGGDGEAGFGIGRQANPATEEEKLFVETAELSKQLAAITAQVDVRKFVEEKGDWTVQGIVDEPPITITPRSSIANVVIRNCAGTGVMQRFKVVGCCNSIRVESCTRVEVVVDDVMELISCDKSQSVALTVGGRGCKTVFTKCSVVTIRVNKVALQESIEQVACSQIAVQVVTPPSARPLKAEELEAETAPDIRFSLSTVVTTTISKGLFSTYSAPSKRRYHSGQEDEGAAPVMKAEGMKFPVTVWAQYPYEAANADELSFPLGAHLLLFGPATEDGWFHARTALSDFKGLVPATHLETPVDGNGVPMTGAPGELPEGAETGAFTAAFPYAAASPDELSFSEGDRLQLLRPADEPGWHHGRHVRSGALGLVPFTHIVKSAETPPPEKAAYTPLGKPDAPAPEKAAPSLESVPSGVAESKPAPPGPPPGAQRLRAAFAYVAAHPDQLSFQEGEEMTVEALAPDEGWLIAKLDSGASGLAPATHVTPMASRPVPTSATPVQATVPLSHASTMPSVKSPAAQS
ncbi:hypothetical protein T484DRAFT_1903990, partial [Baffinella frigidus]